jgi:HlyD family secretion protein
METTLSRDANHGFILNTFMTSTMTSTPKMLSKMRPPKLSKLWLVGLGFGAIALIGGVSYYRFSQRSDLSSSEPAQAVAAPERISALGRLEPESRVIRLSPPLALDGDRILEIRVKEGETVRSGDLIAVLDSRDRLQDELRQANEQVSVAQARLTQIKAGAKSGEIVAQQAEIERLEAEQRGSLEAQAATVTRLASELRNAETEYQRYQSLYQQGAISASQRDSKRLSLDTARGNLQEAQAVQARLRSTSPQQLNQAKANLDRIAEVRPVDVRATEVEANSAIAAVQRAETALEKAYVRAPMSGQILKIQTLPGGTDGIVSLGQTKQMIAIAEVYQSDISKVRVGQSAKIQSRVFPGYLNGSVIEIG